MIILYCFVSEPFLKGTIKYSFIDMSLISWYLLFGFKNASDREDKNYNNLIRTIYDLSTKGIFTLWVRQWDAYMDTYQWTIYRDDITTGVSII